VFFANTDDNKVVCHGSSKPGKRSFGRFSRPLLEVYFQTSFRYEPKVKSLAVAEIFRYCKGFRLSYSYFCLLDQKYKRGVVAAIFSHQLKFSDATGNPYPEWTSCTLQDAVDFLDGQRKPLESADRAKRQGQYPYYGASGIIDYIDDFIFDEPLLLLGEDGANILNRRTPLCFIAEGKYWVNNHAHVMRPKAGQNIKFLCELLESLDYTRYNTGTAQPKLNQDKCRRIGLALPVYEEQCHIADFLSAFDQRTDKAQSILDYLLSNRDGLLQQLFI